ncbi:MAG: hypothetical protein KKC20_22140, partial [Proteobacteria bacterium]|nr:hypothetical protein [Pseudomonadota bacterium]
GRKSPTHLIMDAWIKGIRRLRVIYYHCIEPRFAAELIEAARIMEIDLRIGIEFWARYRGRQISFIWVSRGLPDVQAFLCFLAEPHVVRFMEQGRAVLKYQEKCVLGLLNNFNGQHWSTICRHLEFDIPKLCPDAFLRFAYPGQPSILHLAEYILSVILSAARLHIGLVNEKEQPLDASQELKIKNLVERMENLSVQTIVSTYLSPSQNPEIPHPFAISDDPEVPGRLKLDFKALLDTIKRLHHDFRITLKISNLKPEDVLEILYEGNGLITRLEIINLKDFVIGETDNVFWINVLQKAINESSLLKLKRVVRQIIQGVEKAGYPDGHDRLETLVNILHDIDALKNMYMVRPLKSRIGSDSTGKLHQSYGMGFGIIDTLSPRAVAQLHKNIDQRLVLPASISVSQRITAFPTNEIKPFFKGTMNALNWLPGLDLLMPVKKKEWVFDSFSLDMKKKGNIVTLSGIQKTSGKSLELELQGVQETVPKKSWKNLNTKVKNCLKIFIGFVPAFICFSLTKDWWFLAYFGAFIWFGITGLRNVIQSVLGGGGINRSSLLKWNDYISWDRLTDSLLYTGFSVPLLDYLVKTLILDKGLGINMTSSPIALYSGMGLANGIYLSSHNAFRGFPKGVIAGNFFRSILSIPVAILFNGVIGTILMFFNVPGVEGVLQKWAAIISKAASDTVAGVIEGTADRIRNMNLRKRDIKNKFSDLFETYSRLELLFPETEELKILENPKILFNSRNSEVKDLVVMVIINSLDLFYFWMYLPRARIKMLDMVSRLTPEERTIFLQAQKVLEHEQYISRLFVDGILGTNFSRPLSFYLTTYKTYLTAIKRIDQDTLG